MNTKRCSHCKQEKPLDQFAKNRAMKDGYQAECKECHHVSVKKCDDAHREQRREHVMKWYWANRDEKKAKNNARSRERWHNDPEYRARKNHQKLDLYYNDQDYRKRHLERVTQSVHHRRALIVGSDTSFTTKQWKDLCAKYGNKCLCCGEKTRLTPDHVVPLSRGGSNDISNIQPLCMKCNKHKFTKTIDYRR